MNLTSFISLACSRWIYQFKSLWKRDMRNNFLKWHLYGRHRWHICFRNWRRRKPKQNSCHRWNVKKPFNRTPDVLFQRKVKFFWTFNWIEWQYVGAMSYNQNFNYPPPGFEQPQSSHTSNYQVPSNHNFSTNPQYERPFQRPSGPPPSLHPYYTPPPVEYRPVLNSRPPVPNRFAQPTTPFYSQPFPVNRFTVPPPFHPSRPPPPICFRPNESNFRQSYRAPISTSTLRKRFPSIPSKSSHRRERDEAPLTERDQLLVKWRSNYCETSDDIARKLAEMESNDNKDLWVRSSPADVYYKRCENGDVDSTNRLETLCTLFDQELVARGPKIREKQPPYQTPPRKRKHKVCRHKCKYFLFIDCDECIETLVIRSWEMFIFWFLWRWIWCGRRGLFDARIDEKNSTSLSLASRFMAQWDRRNEWWTIVSMFGKIKAFRVETWHLSGREWISSLQIELEQCQ